MFVSFGGSTIFAANQIRFCAMYTPKGALPCQIAGHWMYLLPDRALWWPERSTVIVSDLHIDKGAHFRKAGIPIPRSALSADLERLEKLLILTSPDQIIITGDVFHSQMNLESEEFIRWCRSSRTPRVIVVAGNHDRHQTASMDTLEATQQFTMDQITFRHIPSPQDGDLFTIGGHFHPGILLGTHKTDRMRLPCFILDRNHLILPAFGRLTGLQMVRPKPHQQAFAIAGDSRVIPIPT